MKFGFLSVFFATILFSFVITNAEESDIYWIKYGHNGATQALFLSDDSQYLITKGADSTLKIFNTINDSLIFKTKTNGAMLFAGISPDNSTLIFATKSITGFIPTITAYDLKQKVQLYSYKIDSAANFQNIGISRDYKYISGISSKNKVYLWDAKTGDVFFVFENDNQDKAYYYSFSPDFKNITIAYDKFIRIYDITTKGLVKELNIINSRYTTRLNYSKDGSQLLVYNSNKDSLDIYDISSGNLESSCNTSGLNIANVILTKEPDKLIFVITNTQCLVWDSKNNKLIKKLNVELGDNNNIIYDDEKELIYTGVPISDLLNGVIKVWDINTDKLVKNITNNYSYSSYCNKGKNLFCNMSAFLDKENGDILFKSKDIIYTVRDSNLYYNRKDSLLYLYSIDNHQLIDSMNFHKKIQAILFSDNMKYFLYSYRDNQSVIYIMDWKNRDVIFSDSIYGFAFSTNNQYFAGINTKHKQLEIIDLIKGKSISKLNLVSISSINCSFSTDSKYVFIRQKDENTKMYNVEDLSLIKEFKLGSEPIAISDITFSPDSNFMVEGAYNGEIRIWDIKSGNLIHKYTNYDEPAYSIDISPDLKYILASYKDGTAILFNSRFGTTSIEDNIKNDNLNLSIIPNPTDGNLKLTISNLENEIVEIKIINQEGLVNKTFSNIKINSNLEELNLNISELPAGVYIVNIRNSNINISNKTVKL